MQTLKTRRFYPMGPVLLAALLLFAQPVGHATAATPPGAREFRMVDTRGKTHTLSGYKGRWVLVNYWATWCPPCLEEIPDLIALHENRQNRLVVLGVALDWKNKKQVTDFAEGLFVSYPIILGDRTITAQIGPSDGLPTSYLFSPEGKLVAHQAGTITREAVESFIRASKARPVRPAVQ